MRLEVERDPRARETVIRVAVACTCPDRGHRFSCLVNDDAFRGPGPRTQERTLPCGAAILIELHDGVVRARLLIEQTHTLLAVAFDELPRARRPVDPATRVCLGSMPRRTPSSRARVPVEHVTARPRPRGLNPAFPCREGGVFDDDDAVARRYSLLETDDDDSPLPPPPEPPMLDVD